MVRYRINMAADRGSRNIPILQMHWHSRYLVGQVIVVKEDIGKDSQHVEHCRRNRNQNSVYNAPLYLAGAQNGGDIST